MTIFYVPLHDVWAMGFATAMAIALFAMLFVIPLAVLWVTAQVVGRTWRLTKRTSGALRGRGQALRQGHTLGVTLPRDR